MDENASVGGIANQRRCVVSAAAKALAALEAAERQATQRQLATINLGYVAALREDGQHLYAATHPAFNADVRYAVAAVNLASPLAAVARAAMAYRESMSFRRTKNSESDYVEWSRAVNDENLAQAELFAAIDALEAAAEGVV